MTAYSKQRTLRRIAIIFLLHFILSTILWGMLVYERRIFGGSDWSILSYIGGFGLAILQFPITDLLKPLFPTQWTTANDMWLITIFPIGSILWAFVINVILNLTARSKSRDLPRLN